MSTRDQAKEQRGTGQQKEKTIKAGTVDNSKGFSLPEIMIAIAVFAAGFAMAAALFPVGMKNHVTAKNMIVGSAICSNGLAEAAAVLRHDVDGRGRLVSPFEKPPRAHYLTPPVTDAEGDNAYPADIPYGPSRRDGRCDKGCLVFGRYFNLHRNDYQIVAVSYDRIAGGAVYAVAVTCTIRDEDGDGLKRCVEVTSGDRPLRAGSPLLHRNTGRYGVLEWVSADRTRGRLKHPWEADYRTDGFYVIVEEGQPIASPALVVLATRTALPVRDTEEDR